MNLARSRAFAFTFTFTFTFITFACYGVAFEESDLPITDPAEERGLISVFAKWNIKANSAQWNFSGEPCSGAATDSTSFDDSGYNPFIKCDCTYNNHSLCHITHLKVRAMDIFGPIPKELWTLKWLTNLNLAQNNLAGPISPSIGNLINMKHLELGSNALSGKIPKEMGQLTELKSLRIQGNNFEGPIPPTFANLSSLTDLRIGEVSNGGSSLEFIKNMKSLEILILRNNNISASLPSDIGEYRNLTLLDLSFNNIHGQIPASLFKSRSLSFLFLGNNSLTGVLPKQKSKSLATIDLSYNNLAGSLPPWANQPNLQLNLVANNFVIDNLTSRILPPGLNCLQQKFPCNRDQDNHVADNSFGINCGGPQVKSLDGMVYERENETLGPAAYYVSSTMTWAVSTVGTFTGSNNPEDISRSGNFQTARQAASSLRYLIFKLRNGYYTVNLQFGEATFGDPRKLKSVDRHIFDVVIQGKLVLKDFDPQKEADGIFAQFIEKKFQVEITENYLEIHLFWAGKGTCCTPTEGTFGPFISSIRVDPDFIPKARDKPPASDKDKTHEIIFIGVAVVVVLVILAFLVGCVAYVIIRTKKKSQTNGTNIELQPLKKFSFNELQVATGNFNKVIGSGGCGQVYLGTLANGRQVAVKKPYMDRHQTFGGEIKILSEVAVGGHPCIVKVVGFCTEGDKELIVLEYMEKGSLQHALYGNNGLKLNWASRFKICLDVAKGLAYLHDGLQMEYVVHSDIKLTNILLDSNFTAKISDFGLAKSFPKEVIHATSRNSAGTPGYIAPEAWRNQSVSVKNDVYSYGIVILHLVTRGVHSDEYTGVVGSAWELFIKKRDICDVLKLVDPSLSVYDEGEVKLALGVALLCTQADPFGRPAMSEVEQILTGKMELTLNTSMRHPFMDDCQPSRYSSSVMSDTAIRDTDSTPYRAEPSSSMWAEEAPLMLGRPF